MLRPRDFGRTVSAALPSAACPERIDTLMLNVTLRCNMACAHCHHSCSPTRTESMSRDTMLDALALAEALEPSLIDVTGGEPELYEHLPELITRARAAGFAVRVRTNLIALSAPEARALPTFFADNDVALLASLPGVTDQVVAEQRGGGAVRDRSIEVLRMLAELGYGTEERLVLDLAYNPPLGELASSQAAVTEEFRSALGPLGVRFDALLSLPNVPLGRYRERLTAERCVPRLPRRAVGGVQPRGCGPPRLPARARGRMGRDAVGLRLQPGRQGAAGRRTADVAEVLADPAALLDRRIGFGPHCFACTAGSGFG